MMSFLTGKARFVCPFCLMRSAMPKHNPVCKHCKLKLPEQYVFHHREVPPVFVPMLGWTQAGKTVFMQSMTLMMENLGKVWPKFVPIPASEITMQFQREIREAISRGELPAPTNRGFNDTYLMLMKNIPLWGGRTLVLRDWAGEHFEAFEASESHVQFLSETRTTFMMVSIGDLVQNPGKTMDELLLTYVNTLLRHGINVKRDRRRIVVILSKADLIKGLPDELSEYLASDPYAPLTSPTYYGKMLGEESLRQYMRELAHIDVSIKQWLQRVPSGLKLLNLANDLGLETRMTLVSSLGNSTNKSNELVTQLSPHRVIDPLLWAIHYSGTKTG